MRQTIRNIYHLLIASLANLWHGFPSKNLIVIGVTGTDGKTTTTSLIHHILKNSYLNSSMISSIGAEINGKKYPLPFHVTTPSPFYLQKFVKRAAGAKTKNYLVLEVTSHSLDQFRVFGINFEVGVITNVTREHLDYHKSYKNYVKAKTKLFRMSKIAILNEDDGSFTIIKRELGSKKTKTIYAGEDGTKLVNVSTEKRNQFCLSDNEVLALARAGIVIEKHYSKLKGHWQPMDLEWAKDGRTNEVFIVQARPETVHSQKNRDIIESYSIKRKSTALVIGAAIGRKIATGKVRVLKSAKQMASFKNGEILVTEITDPDWEPIMKKAAAIITDKGGRTSHAAIVARELGVPAIVGTGNATLKLKTGMLITVDCASGMNGTAWQGTLPFIKTIHHITKIPKIKTHIMMNIGTPEEAFEQSAIPNSGVGLAREEFIIASDIQIHPLALLNFNKITDPKLKREIEKRTAGYASKAEFYVSKLAEGIAQIGAAFYPKPVIVRFSDFKTNEYAQLIGGQGYEPKEENPMIGWRGASRYYDPRFKSAFMLECKAMRRAREQFGLKNIIAMVPFCRTPEEGKKVLETMAEAGLARGKFGLKVYVMCEIPSNVILAKDFLKIFDGFSIGSNDLTQLILGIDRDGERVRSIADERNPAAREFFKQAIVAADRAGKYSGICGQAPSDYPEIAQALVSLGIHSISLLPDTVIPTMLMLAKQKRSKKRL